MVLYPIQNIYHSYIPIFVSQTSSLDVASQYIHEMYKEQDYMTVYDAGFLME
jgi:hypothetical protein